MKYYNLFTLMTAAGLGILLLPGCAADAKPADPALAAENAPKAVFLLQKGQLSSELTMPGELEAFQQVDLYAKVSSFVKKLLVDVGSEVKSGQVLAVLEAPEINSQLAAASSRLKSAEAGHTASKAYYQRLVETSKTPGTISPNDLDMALAKQQADLAQLEAARAAYNEIAENRNYLTIRAPFNGVITRRNVSAGAYVGPSGKGSEYPIFTLQEQGKLRLVAAVPEAYSALVNKQSRISFTVKSLPGETFTAHIARQAGALDTRLRSQRVEMDVVNTGKKLLPGMVAEISFSLPSTDSSFVVPSTAVMNTAEGVYVIRTTGGKNAWVPVKKGRTAGEKTEIFGTLQTGDTLFAQAGEETRNNASSGKIRLDQ